MAGKEDNSRNQRRVAFEKEKKNLRHNHLKREGGSDMSTGVSSR